MDSLMNMRVGVCTGACMNLLTYTDMCVVTCIGMCIDVCMDKWDWDGSYPLWVSGLDMCVDMCIGMFIDMCTDMCTDM